MIRHVTDNATLVVDNRVLRRILARTRTLYMDVKKVDHPAYTALPRLQTLHSNMLYRQVPRLSPTLWMGATFFFGLS